MDIQQLVNAVATALTEAFNMAWEVFWPLILGFALSGAVQAVVSHKSMARLLSLRVPARGGKTVSSTAPRMRQPGPRPPGPDRPPGASQASDAGARRRTGRRRGWHMPRRRGCARPRALAKR